MRKRKRKSIYEKYREILGKPKLSDEEIDKMRVYVKLLALAIIEHVLSRKLIRFTKIMEKEFLKIEVRDIRDSDWYWISRSILEDFAPKIGVVGLALYNIYASYAREKG